jgi:hypothetical protein
MCKGLWKLYETNISSHVQDQKETIDKRDDTCRYSKRNRSDHSAVLSEAEYDSFVAMDNVQLVFEVSLVRQDELVQCIDIFLPSSFLSLYLILIKV